jgi:hypothetical protein
MSSQSNENKICAGKTASRLVLSPKGWSIVAEGNALGPGRRNVFAL